MAANKIKRAAKNRQGAMGQGLEVEPESNGCT